MSNMHALTLASAKHLLTQGHITPQHHKAIVAKVQPFMKPMKFAKPPGFKKPKEAKFGSLAPQQAQAPIPGAMGSAAVPAGTATGYGGGGTSSSGSNGGSDSGA